jgi:PAS domain S-box-containing protein
LEPYNAKADGRDRVVVAHEAQPVMGASIPAAVDRIIAETAASGKLSPLFNGHPTPMWVYDQETLRFLDVNQAAILGYGYSRAEFLGMTILDIQPTADIPLLLHEIRRSALKGPSTAVWRHRSKDGMVFNVKTTRRELTVCGRAAELVDAVLVSQRNDRPSEATQTIACGDGTDGVLLELMSQEHNDLQQEVTGRHGGQHPSKECPMVVSSRIEESRP